MLCYEKKCYRFFGSLFGNLRDCREMDIIICCLCFNCDYNYLNIIVCYYYIFVEKGKLFRIININLFLYL